MLIVGLPVPRPRLPGVHDHKARRFQPFGFSQSVSTSHFDEKSVIAILPFLSGRLSDRHFLDKPSAFNPAVRSSHAEVRANSFSRRNFGLNILDW